MFKIVRPAMGDEWIEMTVNGVVSCVPMDESNTDYQAYLAWVAEGNTAEEWNPQL